MLKVSVLETGHTRYCSISGSDPLTTVTGIVVKPQQPTTNHLRHAVLEVVRTEWSTNASSWKQGRSTPAVIVDSKGLTDGRHQCFEVGPMSVDLFCIRHCWTGADPDFPIGRGTKKFLPLGYIFGGQTPERRSAGEWRAKPKPRAKPEKKMGRGLGRGLGEPLPRKFLKI